MRLAAPGKNLLSCLLSDKDAFLSLSLSLAHQDRQSLLNLAFSSSKGLRWRLCMQAGLNEWNGIRYYRYRDLSASIYGRPGFWATVIMQQIASIGNNISESLMLRCHQSFAIVSSYSTCSFGAERNVSAA